jgi:serine protease Do
MAPGTPIKLKVFRDGTPREINVTLGELPNDDKTPEAEQPEESSLEGISVDNLTPQTLRRLQMPADTNGVIVTNVAEDSAAANAGLQRGDVIQRVNRKAVNNVAEFREAMKQAGQNSAVLLVNRGGRTSFVVIAAQ